MEKRKETVPGFFWGRNKVLINETSTHKYLSRLCFHPFLFVVLVTLIEEVGEGRRKRVLFFFLVEKLFQKAHTKKIKYWVLLEHFRNGVFVALFK